MAIGDIRLTVNRYVRPAPYIGRVAQPQAVTITGNPRLPCFVGRADRLKRESDSKHTRSRVYAETLNFPTAAPYIASLDYDAINDQGLAQISKSNGDPVPIDKWTFVESLTTSGTFDRVQIDDTVFDKNTTYSIEYQSTDRSVLDDLRFDDLRTMLYVGDSEGQAKYVEFVDYRVVTHLAGSSGDSDAATAGSSNGFTTGTLSGVTKTAGPVPPTTGVVSVSGTYNYDYSRHYTLTVDNKASTDPTAVWDFKISVSHVSGGNSTEPNVPFHTSESEAIVRIDQGGVTGPVTFQLNNTDVIGPPSITWLTPMPDYFAADGITISADPGASNFADGDTYEWDAYGPGLVEFSSAHDNTNQYSTVNAPVGANGNTSGNKISINSETNYNDDYDRDYYLAVTNVTGAAAPNRVATIRWSGHHELPFSEGEITVQEATANTYQQVLLERNVYIDVTWGAEHSLSDTTNTITTANASTLPSGLTLAAAIRTAYNAHDNDGGGAWHGAGTGTHQIATAAPIDLATLRTFCVELQTDYAAHLADTTMHTVADTIYPLSVTVTATSSLATLLSFLNNVKLQYNKHRVATNFIDGDSWVISAKAPRRDYTGKDDRTYNLTVNVVNNTSLTYTYHAGTYEGWWGTETISSDGVTWTDTNSDLPDNIRLMFRNLENTESYAANDTFTFSTVNDQQIDWSLVERASETIDSGDIYQDVLGNITGTALSYYVTLNETPTSILRVKESASGNALSYTWLTDTPYIMFTTDPGVSILVDYEWRGDEPDPGNNYFVTANRLRSDDEFNAPIRLLSRDQARAELYPSSTTNHLWIMTEIAFESNFFGCYVVPVQSAAGNEVYSTADYRTAIDGSETNTAISDLVVLSYFGALGYSLNSVNNMNDPFVGRERLLWVGAPRGTEVGDEDTSGTLVYLARNTLQFAPNQPGKGNVILIANTECSRTLQLEDGSTTTVNLDGSFIAGYAAALTASFTDPADTILRKTTASFDTIQEFSDQEELLLGGASVTFLSVTGTGIYQFSESITVDTSEVALNEISARAQEHYVLKRIRREMDDGLMGLVPPSPEAGRILIQNQLVQSLASMASSGIIAPYGSDETPPTIRQINPSSDVYVFVDETDQRHYHFGYYFVTRLPIKRLFGLYSVNTRFWEAAGSVAGPA